MQTITDKPNKEAQLNELRRELKMRQTVYPKWSRQGRIDKETAEFRIRCLIEVIADFEQRHAPAAQQGSLGI